MRVAYTRVSGLSFAENTSKIDLHQGSTVKLVADAENLYDPLAIQVQTEGGQKLGFIAKTGGNGDYRLPLEDIEYLFREQPDAKTVKVTRFEDGGTELWEGIQVGDITSIVLLVEVPDSDGFKPKRCAISKELVMFNEASHVYTTPEGQIYTSGSEFAGRYEPAFNAESIAKRMAGKHGVRPEEILAAWKLKGEVSSSFGTAIHAALEMYGKYLQLSTTVKGDLSYALHDLPAMADAVTKFFDGREEEVARYEVFVADANHLMCGLIDRLLFVDEKKKTVRVQDFKTNVDLTKRVAIKKPFSKAVEKNKLGLYWLQLSFYACILQQKGYAVEGLDIFHWNGYAWNTYTHDVVDISSEI